MKKFAYRGPTDQAEMIALARQASRHNLHVIDLPYRFSSWAFDDPANIALWREAGGGLLAWAVLNRPFLTIDFALHPSVEPAALGTILEWVNERTAGLGQTQPRSETWYAVNFADQVERARIFTRFGYANQGDPAFVPAGDDPWSKVFLRRPANLPLPEPQSLPPGFTLRPLAGQSEVVAYTALQRAVFGSKNMTAGWRARTLQQPAYRPELDLVCAAPGGSLAGFCIGWYSETGLEGLPSGQIEPMGVEANYRGQGLGAAMLNETLRRLVVAGAQQIFVETDDDRGPALALYQSAGFEVIRQVHVYRKDF